MTSPSSDRLESERIGQIALGRVVAVFRWGVILDLGLSRLGLIDALYIDDCDAYAEGRSVEVLLDSFDKRKYKFIAKPPRQTP